MSVFAALDPLTVCCHCQFTWQWHKHVKHNSWGIFLGLGNDTGFIKPGRRYQMKVNPSFISAEWSVVTWIVSQEVHSFSKGSALGVSVIVILVLPASSTLSDRKERVKGEEQSFSWYSLRKEQQLFLVLVRDSAPPLSGNRITSGMHNFDLFFFYLFFIGCHIWFHFCAKSFGFCHQLEVVFITKSSLTIY